MPERLRTRIEEVTSRQLEVARLVAEGRTNPEIASDLGITLDGAKYHVSELLGRLGLERREEIADWYRTERRGQRMRRFSALFASAPKAFLAAAGATAVVAVGVLFAVGLDGARDDASSVSGDTPSPTAAATESIEPGSAPPVGAVGNASDVPLGLQSLPATLAQRLRSDTLPTVVSWERVDWFDGCFDIPPDGGCPLSVSPVPGYRVVMALDGAEYVARTDIEAGRYALEAAPPIAPFEVAFQWTGTHSDAGFLCLDVQVDADGRGSIASCGEAPTAVVLDEDGIAPALPMLGHYNGYEPFTLSLQGRTVEVRGRDGSGRAAGAGQQRAVLEWGHRLAIGSYLGHDGAMTSLSLDWEDPGAQGCTRAQFTMYETVILSSCDSGSNGVSYLSDEQLSQLYEWLDRYRLFEVNGDEHSLRFGGAGTEVADTAIRSRIADWVAAIAEAGPTSSE